MTSSLIGYLSYNYQNGDFVIVEAMMSWLCGQLLHYTAAPEEVQNCSHQPNKRTQENTEFAFASHELF